MDMQKDITISELRSFSRFYTNILGLLNQSILESSYSLTEVRILLEISKIKNCTANTLIDRLDIDRGYLSRLLNQFKDDGVLTKEASSVDGRLLFLQLTLKGRKLISELEEKSNIQAGKLINHLTQDQRKGLIDAMDYIKDSLCINGEDIKIRTFKPGDIEYIIKRHRELYESEYGFSSEFGDYVEKYVVQFSEGYDKNKENIWIAEFNSKPVGVIAIAKAETSTAQLRWFLIEPEMRGKGLGHKLMKTAMDFAREKNYNHVFLWTVNVLEAARHVYGSYGFQATQSVDNTSWTNKLIKEERWDLYL